jgi:hypothetical protein
VLRFPPGVEAIRPMLRMRSVFSAPVAGGMSLVEPFTGSRRVWSKTRVSFHALLVAGFLATSMPQPARANEGSVVASEMNGYGRIILSFPKPIATTARSSNGILVVTFEEPVELDYNKLPMEAPEYIAVARRDPDQRTLRFAMTQPFNVDLKMAGEKVFIDLLPESWQGLPPGLPSDVVDDLARRARAAEDTQRQAAQAADIAKPRPLGVRVGTTPTFSRVVFDTEIVVPVQYSRNQDEVRLVFDAALQADAEEIRTKLAGLITSFRLEQAEKSLTLVMTVPVETPVKGFREDNSFVLDIIDAEAERLKKAEAQAAAVAAERQASKDAMIKVPAKQDDPAKTVEITAPAEAVNKPALRPAGPPAMPVTEEKEPAGPIKVSAGMADEKTTMLDFDFGRRGPAAVFGQGDGLWLVFDTKRPIELPQLPPDAAKIITAMDVEAVSDAQVVRLGLAPGAVPSLKSTDNGWVLHVGSTVAARVEPLMLKASVNAVGRSVVSADMKNVGRVIWFDNSGSGERYAVAMSSNGPSGVTKSQRFVEFSALRSLQGLVIAQIADDLTVTSALDEVVIGRGQGLAITQDRASSPDQPASSAPMMLLNGAAWDEETKGNSRDRERELFRLASEAPARERSARRKQLADFYLANQLPSEALGVLQASIKEEPALLEMPVMRMSLGVAHAMASQFDEAGKVFADRSLAEVPEVDLWRGYMAAQKQDWQSALVAFRKALPVLDQYPERLQTVLRPMIVNAAVEGDDYNFAGQQLDYYERLKTGLEKPALADLLRGRVAESSGRVDDALVLYDVAAKSKDRDIEAKARLYRVLLKHKDKRLDTPAVEAELETLGVIWRGDELELKALDVLSGLYASNDRWREAFGATRRALEINSEHQIARNIQDKMAVQFESLFLDGKADALDKVKSLALYYDFRNFTPPGRKGDDIVRRLADRLISLDLLEEAAALLQHQVTHRLDGTARSSVATKLAVVYLQDEKPVEALRVLKDSRLSSIPDDLKRARALVEARALAELTRTDLAIEMVANQKGPEVDRLRADIYWTGKRWREAGEAYELVAGDGWRDPAKPMSDQERSDVMRSAIAYVLSDEGLSLTRLTAKYADKMAATVDAQPFALVSSGAGAKQADFRDIAKVAISSGSMTEFLRSYRERYPDQAGPEPVKVPAADDQVAPPPLGPKPMEDDKAEQADAGPAPEQRS